MKETSEASCLHQCSQPHLQILDCSFISFDLTTPVEVCMRNQQDVECFHLRCPEQSSKLVSAIMSLFEECEHKHASSLWHHKGLITRCVSFITSGFKELSGSELLVALALAEDVNCFGTVLVERLVKSNYPPAPQWTHTHTNTHSSLCCLGSFKTEWFMNRD